MGLGLGARLGLGGAREASTGRRLWGASFAAAAAAAAVGALRHGWGSHFSPEAEWGLWYLTALGIAAAGALLLAGAAVACCVGTLQRALLGLSALRFAAVAVWTATHREYLVLAVDSALGTGVVLWLLGLEARAGRFAGLQPVAGGVAIGLGGALLRQLGVAPHPHFNENDLYHVVQAASLWAIARGGRHLRDRDLPSRGDVVASAP